MKNILLAAGMLFIISSTYAQNDTLPEPQSNEEEMEFNTPEKTRVRIGQNEVFIIEDNGDTTRFQLGKKGMSIIEDEDGYTIDIVEMDDDKGKTEEKKSRRSKSKFKPHFAGLELGLNNFSNPDYTLHTGTFMNLNTAKSWNVNLNFIEYGVGLGTPYVGIATGMGVEWSNYVFDADNSITEDANGNIINRDLSTVYTGITKSKLATTYLTTPLLLEFQIPAGKKRIHISAGAIGGLKIGSKTKVKYNNGGKQKEVLKDDFSLSPLKYGVTFRIGYRALNIFANYYLSPLFGETDTPEIYPFSVGLSLLDF